MVRGALFTISSAVLDSTVSLLSKDAVTVGFSSVDATSEVGEIGDCTAICVAALPDGVTKAPAAGTKAAAAAAAAILLRLI